VNYKFIKLFKLSSHLLLLKSILVSAEFGGFFAVRLKPVFYLILVGLPTSFPADWGLCSIILTCCPEVMAGLELEIFPNPEFCYSLIVL